MKRRRPHARDDGPKRITVSAAGAANSCRKASVSIRGSAANCWAGLLNITAGQRHPRAICQNGCLPGDNRSLSLFPENKAHFCSLLQAVRQVLGLNVLLWSGMLCLILMRFSLYCCLIPTCDLLPPNVLAGTKKTAWTQRRTA